MARKKSRGIWFSRSEEGELRLRPETKKSVVGIILLGIGVIFALAGFHAAGPAGDWLFNAFQFLFGWGYSALPLGLLLAGIVFLTEKSERLMGLALLGVIFLIFSVLGLIDLFANGKGGILGLVFGSLKVPFGMAAAVILTTVVFLSALLVTLNVPLKLRLPSWKRPLATTGETEEEVEPDEEEEGNEEKQEAEEEEPQEEEAAVKRLFSGLLAPKRAAVPARNWKNYVPPTLDLLKSATEKPTTGDLRANANIIKRTLESFGIAVEMGEINIGPKVTRYTLKPAEGMKLSRITALHQDIALALAAHPIRIEAPIPGKSLVGIEVPNKAAALVRLGSLMAYPEFQKSGPLGIILGRDVSGEPVFADIEKMPHLLVAGATGSGKSIMIHSIITSLLYKNSPETLRLILVDPKRVELSTYENIPHLVSSVVTESKKAMGVFRWAIKEMERRYDLLLAAGSRDIKSYNANDGKEDPLPYLLIVVDELADLMASYGREVESSIIRLAQMARATGLHLVLSTQRPSVEVITGLIKANITSRIALQVASQIDSRTILDTSGAEKLLGGGDLLFVSSDLSKPKRIQGCYVTEEEVNKVADFVRDNNESTEEESVEFSGQGEGSSRGLMFTGVEDEEEGDELYDEAVQVVRESQKASASFLQRRLKVGYARAARLLDLMEASGLIGPGEGAKPREVYEEKIFEREA